MAEVPSALAAGTAQCPETYLRPGGRLKDSEGVLGFYQDWFVFYADSGRTNKVPYTGIKSYSIRRGLVLRKLTLHGIDGSRVRFKIGRELAANADYILAANEVPWG